MTEVAELPRPIGYVLGGGASLGAMQVGMLPALSADRICSCPLLPARADGAAVRGLRPPVDPDGRRLYDGGIVNAPIR